MTTEIDANPATEPANPAVEPEIMESNLPRQGANARATRHI